MATGQDLAKLVVTRARNGQSVVSTNTQQQRQDSRSLQTLQDLVLRLWRVMETRKPHLLNSAYSTDKMIALGREEYATQLRGRGITKAMIEKGIEKLKNKYPLQYLPDPVEFAEEYCKPRPEDFGLPTNDEAWEEVNQHCHEVTNHKFKHEAVKLAARGMWNEIRGECDDRRRKELRKRYFASYDQLVNRLMAGEDISGGAHHQLEYMQETPAQKADRLAELEARRTREEQGIPEKMSAEEALKRMMKL